jgi:hypothetical protein
VVVGLVRRLLGLLQQGQGLGVGLGAARQRGRVLEQEGSHAVVAVVRGSLDDGRCGRLLAGELRLGSGDVLGRLATQQRGHIAEVRQLAAVQLLALWDRQRTTVSRCLATTAASK